MYRFFACDTCFPGLGDMSTLTRLAFLLLLFPLVAAKARIATKVFCVVVRVILSIIVVAAAAPLGGISLSKNKL